MTAQNPRISTPTGEVPGEVPSEVPAGTSWSPRSGEVPGSLSYGGTSPDRPQARPHHHEVPSEVPTLFNPVTAHCFFGWCNRTVTDLDPDAVHATMEHHYATTHRQEIDALLPRVSIRARLVAGAR